MENRQQAAATDKQETQLITEEVQDLQVSLRYFSVNYPPDTLKKILWELYKG